MGRHPGRAGLRDAPPLKAGCGERSLLGPVGGTRKAPGSLGGVRLNPLGPVGGALSWRGGVSRCILCWRGGDWSRRTGDSPPHRRGGGGVPRWRLPVGERDREGDRLGLAGLPHCRILTGPSETCANAGWACWPNAGCADAGCANAVCALPHSRSRRGAVGGCHLCWSHLLPRFLGELLRLRGDIDRLRFTGDFRFGEGERLRGDGERRREEGDRRRGESERCLGETNQRRDGEGERPLRLGDGEREMGDRVRERPRLGDRGESDESRARFDGPRGGEYARRLPSGDGER